MSDLDVKSDTKSEGWLSSTSSRTRPLPTGQYTTSISPSLVTPKSKSLEDDSNNDNSYKSSTPVLPSTGTVQALNGIKDGDDKVNSASCPPVENSQIRVPDSKNLVALTTKNSRHHRKEAGIPVGIAVAWQRLVTSAATSPTTTNTSTMSSCSGRADSPSLLKSSNNNKPVKVNLPSPTIPKRPLSTNSAPGGIAPSKDKAKNNHNRITELKSRPASVNLPIHNNTGTTQSKSVMSDQQYLYRGLNSQYADWPGGLNVPHLSPNLNAAAAAAAYMHHHSQMSLQQQHLQQLHLSHNQNSHYGALPLAHPYAYSGYSPEALQKYEQYLQQAELQRHHELHYHHQLQQQHQLQQEYEIQRAAAIPSPRISIPSPSPTLHSHSLWPPELFHHNSSTTLSPKSLTSTPSPVTVQDGSNFLSTSTPVRRSGTPTNKNLMASPSPPTPKEQQPGAGWRDVKITPVSKIKKCDDAMDSVPPAIDVAKMEEEVIRDEKLVTLLGVDRKKHDFTRMESLIERRDEVSVPLLKVDEVKEGGPNEEDEGDRKKSTNNSKYNNKHNNSPGLTPKLMSAIDNPRGLNGLMETEIKPCDVEVNGGVSKQVPDINSSSKLNLSSPFVPVKVEPVDSCGNSSSRNQPENICLGINVKPLIISSEGIKKDTGSLGTYNDNNNVNKLRENSYLANIKTERKTSANSNFGTGQLVTGVYDWTKSDPGGITKTGVIAIQPYTKSFQMDANQAKASVIKGKVEPILKDPTSIVSVHQSVVVKPERPSGGGMETTNKSFAPVYACPPGAPLQQKPYAASMLDVNQIKQEPQQGSKSIDNPGIPVVGSAKLIPKIETDYVTKCDTDINKFTAVKPLSSFSSSSNNIDSSSLDLSISQSVKADRTPILFGEYQQQQQQSQQLQLQHQLIGNTSYNQDFTVPLPPPAHPSCTPLIVSPDRKLVVKAENKQDPITTTSDHNILAHHRFHHNFLPIEEENNHLNLLATVAQEFGNEIGLIHKPHRPFSQAFDTYEFKEEPTEKIDPFGHQHVLTSVQSRMKSLATPAEKPPQVIVTSAGSTTPAVTKSSTPPLVAPIVLRIPQVKSIGSEEPAAKKKAKPTKKTEKIDTAGAGKEQSKSKRLKHLKERNSKHSINTTAGGEKSKSKMKIYGSELPVTTEGSTTNVITEMEKERRKWKRQMITGNTLDPVCETKELKVAPLKLTKRRSTTDAIVMKKGTGNRNNLGSSSNKIKKQRYSVETSVPFVWSQSQWQIPSMKQNADRMKLANEKAKSNIFKLSSTSSDVSNSNIKDSTTDPKTRNISDGLQTTKEEGQSVPASSQSEISKSRKPKKPRKSVDERKEQPSTEEQRQQKLSQKPNALSQDLKSPSMQSKNNNTTNLDNSNKNPRKRKAEQTDKNKHPLTTSSNKKSRSSTTTALQPLNNSSVSYSWNLSDSPLPEHTSIMTNGLIGNEVSTNALTADDLTSRLIIGNKDVSLFSPVSTSSNLENDWAANPTHAVTAIQTDSPPVVLSPCHNGTSSDKNDRRNSKGTPKSSKLTLMNFNSNQDSKLDMVEKSNNDTINNNPVNNNTCKKSPLKPVVHFAPHRRASLTKTTNGRHVIKPSLKAEPIIRRNSTPSPEHESDYLTEKETKNIDIICNTRAGYSTTSSVGSSSPKTSGLHDERDESHMDLPDINESISKENPLSKNADEQNEQQPEEKSSAVVIGSNKSKKDEDTVVITNVSELLDDMRILTEIQGLFYTGKLNALQPPDVYGVTLDNERGAPPHIIFSAEEVLEKCIREAKPKTLEHGLRICAYWSPQYSGLYPGKISMDYVPSGDPHNDLIPIEFDDGDTGVIKLNEIRLLASDHPIREYDPNPLLTLEKKHRKRRHSSATGSQIGCTGDHEEADCGEPYCAKVGKYEEEDKGKHSSKNLYWTWFGLGFKRSRSKKDRNKEFFEGIQRGDEIIKVGDSALFISSGNDRPFIGRVEKLWEKKGQKVVKVRWYYHPDEVKVKTTKRLQGLYTGALFESPHIDENDVQTISKKCDVVSFEEFKGKVGCLTKWSRSTSQRGIYYVTGSYDPYTYNLQLKDLK